jgi:hypothetical protein
MVELGQKHNGLDKEAGLFLDALIDECEPGFQPEETAEWADAFLRNIRNFRNSQRGKEIERAATRLGREVAADPYRFFWEFWQNADDARATELNFVIYEDKLIITNNGDPFKAVEVFSLIFVASTTKASRTDLIGRFGIGSLTLMRVSESPIYYSGHYAFKLERSYTYPAKPTEMSNESFQGTKVIAPFMSGVNPSDLYEALAAKMDTEALLYMKNLKRVSIRDEASGREKKSLISPQQCGNGDLVTVGDQEWVRFVSEAIPPSGTQRDDGTEVVDPVRITFVRRQQSERSHPVCAFFPTKIWHHYPWRFSAPFDVVAGREVLVECEFNRWLLRETGRAMVQAAVAKGVGNPSQPWDLVPIEGDDNNLINEVWEGALEAMSSLAWLPTSTTPIKPSQAVFPESPAVRRLVGKPDLLALGQGHRRWIEGIPPPNVRLLLHNLGALRLCCHVLSQILAKGPTNRKPQWYLEALATVIELASKLGDDEVISRLINGKCILAQNKRPVSLSMAQYNHRLVCNTRSEILAKQLGNLFPSRLILLLHKIYRLPDRKTNDPDDELRRKIDEWLRTTSSDTTFSYQSRLDAATFIRRFVVEGAQQLESEKLFDQLLDFVRDNVEAYVSDQGQHRREQLLLELGKSLKIKAHTRGHDGRRISEYRPISKVYVPAGFLDKPTWALAARDVPGLWWADWHYRKRLARPTNPIGVVGFLRGLGAATGPRIQHIPNNSSHGVHQFTRVTHNDPERYPNFPHSKVSFGYYSEFGLIGDSESNDLTAWWGYVSKLAPKDRSLRGERLLRAIEDGWELYKSMTVARATAYRANAENDLGAVPSLWVWHLQQWGWVTVGKNNFTKPSGAYVRTDTNLALLYPERENLLCQWVPRNVDVARALGFSVDVPPSAVIAYLNAARSEGRLLSTQKAGAYYKHLSSCGDEVSGVHGALKEGLLYSPGHRCSWWTPTQCLRDDQRAIFGEFCGYLANYAEAGTLWDKIGVPLRADPDFLTEFWHNVSREDPRDQDLRRVLAATYQLAEDRLTETKLTNREVPVVAEGQWCQSTLVFSTSSDTIAEELRAKGLHRWDYEYPDLVPRLQQWTGILDVERTAKLVPISLDTGTDSVMESRIHAAVQAFGAEISRISGELWRAIGKRLHDILKGRLYVAEPLKVQVRLHHPTVGNLDIEVTLPALCVDGNLYISRLTKLSDPVLARAIMAGIPLVGEARWGAINSLRAHLMSEPADSAEPLPMLEAGLPDLPEGLWEQQGTEGDGEKEKDIPPQNLPKRKQPKVLPAPYPADNYEVQSDECGETPRVPTGGLIGRKQPYLKKPRRDSRKRHGAGGAADRHPPMSTEERAVYILRTYVFEPDNVNILDQRIRHGVGADLIGDDNVFREMKSHSGSAPSVIGLTEHEYKRASESRSGYDLVIVEHVWDTPLITIISNPLGRLRYSPTGGVEVHGWRDLDPKPRIIRLRKRDNDT